MDLQVKDDAFEAPLSTGNGVHAPEPNNVAHPAPKRQNPRPDELEFGRRRTGEALQALEQLP
jgi:hypothetical protein